MTKRIERLEMWASELTIEQLRAVVVKLVDYSVDTEVVSFYDGSLVPYWPNTGDPLVAGQKIYSEEN